VRSVGKVDIGHTYSTYQRTLHSAKYNHVNKVGLSFPFPLDMSDTMNSRFAFDLGHVKLFLRVC